MSLSSLLPIIILFILWGAQLKKRSFLSRHIKAIFWSSISISLLSPFYYPNLLFLTGINSPAPARYFYPPYQSVSYFILRINHLYWIPAFLSIAIALLVLLSIFLLRADLREKFFFREEPYIIALGIALVGHPLWILYIGLTLILYLLFASFRGMKTRSSFYAFWLPSAIIISFLSPILKSIPFISILILSR